MSQTQIDHEMQMFLEPTDDKLYELVEGKLVEKKMATLAVWVAGRILVPISKYLDEHDLGWATTELPINCFPWLTRHGRRPDACFFNYDRHPGPDNEQVLVAPNLVIEVISPGDNVVYLERKIDEYFKAGVDLIWIVNPENQTVRIQRTDGTGNFLHAHDSITGETVLPGLSVRVSEFFPKPKVKA